jgi:long-chain fatty acid transport protein
MAANLQGVGTEMSQRLEIGHRVRLALAVGGLSLAGATTANAAGFALIEQSVPGAGTAYAGAAATADSVDTLYFNPAGMTRLPGTRAGTAVHLIEPNTKFSNAGTRDAVGNPILGGDGGDANDLAAVPHFYLTHQLNDKSWLGLAVNAPFGLTTEYKSDWVGRYHAIKSQVTTLNINPSIAYRINDRFSFALGVSAMYLDGEFTNAVDFGLLNLPLPGNPLAGWAGDPTVGAGDADGKLELTADAWSWGGNVGLLFEPSEDTRIGVHYRSEVKQKLEGGAKFRLPNPALAAAFPDSDVKVDVDLPATVSLSGFHQLNRAWAVVGDYTWTGWSSIPELRFRFDSGLPDGVTTFDWKDTSRVAIGAIYTPENSDWTYRLGAAYDESPIKDAASLSARLPDADRIWLSVGAGFSPSEALRIDFGYAHLFKKDAKISKTASGEDRLRGALNGSYEGGIDILSIEAQYAF